jgi:hypothetical protein
MYCSKAKALRLRSPPVLRAGAGDGTASVKRGYPSFFTAVLSLGWISYVSPRIDANFLLPCALKAQTGVPVGMESRWEVACIIPCATGDT